MNESVLCGCRGLVAADRGDAAVAQADCWHVPQPAQSAMELVAGSRSQLYCLLSEADIASENSSPSICRSLYQRPARIRCPVPCHSGGQVEQVAVRLPCLVTDSIYQLFCVSRCQCAMGLHVSMHLHPSRSLKIISHHIGKLYYQLGLAILRQT